MRACNRAFTDTLAKLKRRKAVNPELNRTQQFFERNPETGENLWQYVQSLSPETIAQLSRPESPDVFQVIERNIIGMLGTLPSEHFDVEISTNRENLGRLLASAMVSGYFLRNAEQRMHFEKAFQEVSSSGEG